MTTVTVRALVPAPGHAVIRRVHLRYGVAQHLMYTYVSPACPWCGGVALLWQAQPGDPRECFTAPLWGCENPACSNESRYFTLEDIDGNY